MNLPPEIQQLVETWIHALESQANDTVSRKTTIESRWKNDLRQYHGRYDTNVENKFNDEKSKAFANITRPKCHTAEARLFNMLFPTDDRNWGIKPTPVPDMPSGMPMAGMPNMAGMPTPQNALAEAKTRAEAMQQEMDDQLTESHYQMIARDVILDAVVYGSGIMKGPLVRPTGNGYTPYFERVDPWDFFPDMNGRTMDEVEFIYQRHLMTRKQFAALARLPGFDAAVIADVLESDARTTVPTWVSDVRAISGVTSNATEKRYSVWEYHGPVDTKIFQALTPDMDDQEKATLEMNAVVWFIDGKLLKFGLAMNETLPYSVFCWEKSLATVFGYGIPFLLQHSQSVMNAAYRMILDNAVLSTGPQIVMDRRSIEPADGDWTIKPRKIWFNERADGIVSNVFNTFSVDSHQVELNNIFVMARNLADEESGQSTLSQGDVPVNSPHNAATQTAAGISMMQGAGNIIQSRIVRNWDDDLTRPTIERLYKWNMEFHQDPQIKGDFEVDARGSTVLMAKEIHSQLLMNIASNFAAHPVFGPLIKAPQLLRNIAASLNLKADEFILTDEEIQTQQQQMQAQQQAMGGAASPGDPVALEKIKLEQAKLPFEQVKLQLEQNRLQLDAARLSLDRERHQLEMQLAQTKLHVDAQLKQSDQAVKVEQIKQASMQAGADMATRERMQANELKLKMTMGQGI
ncbi:MAG: hypothetical protein H7833_00445 [Magnetococcus sp. DMHC-1]